MIPNLDARLTQGDHSLVSELGHTKTSYFYSFATKYCSHHNETKFAIYDFYVKRVLCHFRNVDKFYIFKNYDLKDYNMFMNILSKFIKYYQLDSYSLKNIDIYL